MMTSQIHYTRQAAVVAFIFALFAALSSCTKADEDVKPTTTTEVHPEPAAFSVNASCKPYAININTVLG